MLVFVGSRTTRERNARGAGLSVYEVDATFTHWRLTQTLELVNPSFLLANRESRRLYAVHGDFSDVSSLAVDRIGRLALLNQQAVRGRNPVHLELTADSERLIIASYATGSMSALPIRPDGSLGEVAATLQLHGTPGPHRIEQKGSHPHHTPRWPRTNLFVVPNKGLDRVHVVRLTAEGALELVSEAVARSCSGPRHVAFDAALGRVWVANELDSTVTAHRFDPSSGLLQAERIVSLLPDDFTGESRAAGIVAARDTLYVSNRGHDSVTVIRVDRATGAMAARQWQSTLGYTPRFLTLTPDGSCLLVTNEGSDTIVRYRVRDDGLLADGQVVAETGSPVCVAFMPSPTHP
ncbi:MAG TPA: lactonase family protein [Burkholderiaceae bacterium]|nr:lactonase family protein [Burkholderiaceae bacterium]